MRIGNVNDRELDWGCDVGHVGDIEVMLERGVSGWRWDGAIDIDSRDIGSSRSQSCLSATPRSRRGPIFKLWDIPVTIELTRS